MKSAPRTSAPITVSTLRGHRGSHFPAELASATTSLRKAFIHPLASSDGPAVSACAGTTPSAATFLRSSDSTRDSKVRHRRQVRRGLRPAEDVDDPGDREERSRAGEARRHRQVVRAHVRTVAGVRSEPAAWKYWRGRKPKSTAIRLVGRVWVAVM